MSLPVTVFIKEFKDLFGTPTLHAYHANEGGTGTEYVRKDIFDQLVKAAIQEAKKNGEKYGEPYERT